MSEESKGISLVMQRARNSQLLLAGLLLLGRAAAAEDAFLVRWQALRANQPPPVTLLVSAGKTDFYMGELISLHLSFTSSEPKSFLAGTRLQDRVGRLNGVEEFLIEPAAAAEDPLRGLPGEKGMMGGLSGGDMLLSGQPFTFEDLLNDWVRFRKPGRYRVAILSRRVTHVTDPSRSEFYLRAHGDSSTPLELVSNILTLNIAAPPPAWVKEQTADAARILDAPFDLSEETQQRRLRAGRTLRYLDTLESASRLARHLGDEQGVDVWSVQMGILGSAHRQQLLPFIEARLISPGQAVSDLYLNTLFRLSELAGTGGSLKLAKQRQYIARLIAALPSKEPAARAVSINTLVDFGQRDGNGEPESLRMLAASLIAGFTRLPSRMQSNLLETRWSLLKSPAMLPVLREIYAHPAEPRVDPPLQDTAVRRIYDLAPEEGRRLILSELARPDTYLSINTLRMLPDRSLPELDDVLAARLEAGQYADLLILRYATAAIVKRVENAYTRRTGELERQKLPHCAGPLTYYFLRHDPPFGEKELRNEMDQPAPFPACYDIGFQFSTLDGGAYSPALERLAIEFLGSPKVPVKRGAAEVLGKYGSPAAQKPLWDTFEYFHSWWKGREEQLDDAIGQEGMQFERALRIALAQADSWTLQADGLQRLLALCSSGWCQQEVRGWLSQATPPVSILMIPGPDRFHVSVAQYETKSEEGLRRKIQQFPAGTVFRALSTGTGTHQTRPLIEQLVRSAGYTLAPP